MTTNDFKTLNYAVDSEIATITLDKPPLNLINEDSTREYHRALVLADEDPGVKVIILMGAGKGLSAGLDLKFLDGFDSTAMEKFLRLFYIDTLKIVRGLSKPIIAAASAIHKHWATRSKRVEFAITATNHKLFPLSATQSHTPMDISSIINSSVLPNTKPRSSKPCRKLMLHSAVTMRGLTEQSH
jgi:hypothetical protein